MVHLLVCVALQPNYLGCKIFVLVGRVFNYNFISFLWLINPKACRVDKIGAKQKLVISTVELMGFTPIALIYF